MISMDKKYRTRDGLEVRVLCVDRAADSNYPVVALVAQREGYESVEVFTTEGIYSISDGESDYDLIEVQPYDDYEIGDPVMVRNGTEWCPRYFAGVNDHGKPTAWHGGATRWTNGNESRVSWNECRRPTEAELND